MSKRFYVMTRYNVLPQRGALESNALLSQDNALWQYVMTLLACHTRAFLPFVHLSDRPQNRRGRTIQKVVRPVVTKAFTHLDKIISHRNASFSYTFLLYHQKQTSLIFSNNLSYSHANTIISINLILLLTGKPFSSGTVPLRVSRIYNRSYIFIFNDFFPIVSPVSTLYFHKNHHNINSASITCLYKSPRILI